MIEAIKKHKRIVAVVVILILTAVIELICNFPAIRGGYDDLDLTKYMTVEEEENREKYVISYSSPQKFYIKELHLSGTFPKEYYYTIKTKEYNSFDKESEEYYSDTVNSWFSDFYTNLNKKVTSVEITLNKPENAELTAVSCSNKFEINKYRVLFFLVAFSMIYFCFFEKKVVKYPERFFAIYAFVFGILIVFFAQPMKISWDEQIHFGNAYTLASGKNVVWTEAAKDLQEAISVTCNTKAEYAELRQYMDDKGMEYLYTETKETLLPSYTMFAYIPQAIFLKLGLFFNLPFSILFAFGKLGNLLLYISIMYAAIYLAKSKKIFLLFIAMMPTVIFQASSYTYDMMVFSCITLACVLWANEMFYTEKKTETWKIIIMVLLFVFGSYSKAVYIPLMAVILLLPSFKNISKKKKLVMWGSLLLILLLVMMTFVLPTLTSTVARDLSVSGDARGGDTGVVRQMISMLKHPWASVKLMISSVFSFDNFRNLGFSYSDDCFWGNLMLLNFASCGILADKWSILLVSMITILLLYQDVDSGQKVLKMWDKIVITVMLMGTIFFIWLALYLSFTPVGENTILGVQARYYLPLLYFVAVLVRNKRIKFVCKQNLIMKITIFVAQLLGWTAMYQCMLVGRLV